MVAVGFAPDGRMVACDWGNDRLQWFDAAGRFLYTEESLGLDRPYDAQVYADRCFVADSHHGEVVVFSI